MAVSFNTMTSTLFLHWFSDEPLDGFHLLLTVDEASLNTDIQVLVWKRFYFSHRCPGIDCYMLCSWYPNVLMSKVAAYLSWLVVVVIKWLIKNS